MERSAGDSVRRTPTVSQNLPLIDYKRGSSNLTETRDNGKRSDHLNDVSDRIMTSKELVKILTRVNKLGDHHYHNNQTASKRLILALRSELDRARSTLKCLIREQSDGDVARLMECFAEEKRRWRRRMEREVAAERKLRQQTERMNKKLSRELADAKAETRRLTEELQRESRAKEILEQVCDELVRGVGEDKVEAERIMKEAERVKAEVEKEREMMHIADVLREERVQMKLTDAKFEFEEKNAVVERLRNELRRVLTEEQEEEDGKGYSPSLRHIKRVLDIIDGCGAGGGAEGGEGSDQESDLKSIELNMDSFNKSYKWSYVESGQFSDKDHRRKSGFPISGDGDSEDSVDKTSVIVDFQTRDGEEIDRDKSIKSLRDYIMSNVRIVGSSEQWNRIVGTPE